VATDALKIAKLQRATTQDLVVRDVVVSILGNPILGFVAGTWGILALQERYGAQAGFGEFFQQGAGITAVAGISTAQALSPILPDLLKAGTETVSGIARAVPMLKGVG